MSDEEIAEPADQLVIELEDDVIEKLRQRASSHGRSLDEEVREIIRNAVKNENGTRVGLGSQLAAIFHGAGIEEEIAEQRGHPVEPIDLNSRLRQRQPRNPYFLAFQTSATFAPISLGASTTWIPAAFSASIFSDAVPLPPLMIAPA